jgi:putative ABC transport system permease protein
METLLQDLRFAVRLLGRSPGFTAVAILCIALGIGTNVTAFSVVSATLLRPFPFAQPERLVYLRGVNPGKEVRYSGISYPDYQDLRAAARSFSQIGAYAVRSFAVATDGGEPERISGVGVSAGLFPLFGERPMLGRLFREEEDRPGAAPVVLLGHDLWVRRFGGDPGVVGRSVMINSAAYTVVGVMQPRFGFPISQEAWVPLAPIAYKDLRNDRSLQVVGRLAPGVSYEAALAEMRALAKRLETAYPDMNFGWGGTLRPMRDEFVDEGLKVVVLTILGAVIFILLIACSNVANLFLARATARQREVAVRVAFGAGRWRIARQLLTESLLIAALGGALGILLGYFGIRWMAASIPAEDMPPYWMTFDIDHNVLIYTLATTFATALLFGLAPALQAVQPDLHGTLKEGGRGSGGSVRRNRLRSGLVVVEIALALALLVVTSLFLRSFLKLQGGDAGFSTAHLLTMRVYLPGEPYEEEPPKRRLVAELVRRLEEIPGVEAVGASNTTPLSGGTSGGTLLIQGRSFPRGKEPSIDWIGTSPHYFQALGLRPRRGRILTDREAMEKSTVAVVNEAFVKKFFPGAEPLGQRFRIEEEKEIGWMTIVGVMPDVKHFGVASLIYPIAYLPYPYLSGRATALTVRTEADPAKVTAAARAAIRAAGPEIPIYQVYTMEQVREQGFWQYRMLGGMFSVFGGIALFLAAIGVYGVLAYSVSQRIREIGVRVALGAQRGDVLRLIVGQGLRLALFGVGAGVVLGLGAGRVVKSVLYEVSPADPVSFVAISLLLTVIASLASFMPASRAMQVDPLEALRNE